MIERICRLVLTTIFLTLTLAAMGCDDSPDQRLAHLASSAMDQQAEQNRQMAEQHQTVIEASKSLVDADAAARRDVLAAHAELANQRDLLERDRKELDRAKHREPILAATIEAWGMLMACLVPLGLACYIVFQAGRSSEQASDRLIADFLVTELTRHAPKIISLPKADIRLGGGEAGEN